LQSLFAVACFRSVFIIIHQSTIVNAIIATVIHHSSPPPPTTTTILPRYVDLLYGARAWEVLLSRWHSLPAQLSGWHQVTSATASDSSSDSDRGRSSGKNTADDSSQEASLTTTTPSPLLSTTKDGGGEQEVDWVGVQIMYLHTGGLEGTSSQLNRYKHAGLVESHETM
jgi:hypothetical protein